MSKQNSNQELEVSSLSDEHLYLSKRDKSYIYYSAKNIIWAKMQKERLVQQKKYQNLVESANESKQHWKKENIELDKLKVHPIEESKT